MDNWYFPYYKSLIIIFEFKLKQTSKEQHHNCKKETLSI